MNMLMRKKVSHGDALIMVASAFTKFRANMNDVKMYSLEQPEKLELECNIIID